MSLKKQKTTSELEHLIAAEIKDNRLYASIFELASRETISSILEIGSSSGEGSTEAFVKGIVLNPNHPTLYCMEVSKTRFSSLQSHYQNIPQVICYNVSSVPRTSFPSEKEVTQFYLSCETKLNRFSLNTVLAWLEQDITYIKDEQVPENGIEIIKGANNITHFDMVLIDGSEFTGEAELQHLYGARYILLDDIDTYKNYNNYHRLLNDTNYALLEENHQERHGYAIFKRKDFYGSL